MKSPHGGASADERVYAPKDELVAEFAAKLRLADGRSPRTCEAYARDVEQFAGFLGDGGFALLPQATTAQVRRFVMDLVGVRAYKAAAVRRKLVSLRGFFAYLRAEKLRADNPALDVKPPKAGKRLPVVMREAEVSKLLATQIAGRTDFQRLRDRAILELLYASGLRRAEIASLNLQDVDLERRVLRVIGKGDKERVTLFNQAAADAMRAYLALRPRTADEAFFLGRYGRRLGPRQVWAIFKVFADLSGISTHATPHVMRHSFATHLLENGADLMMIKELLGHESLATTGIYTNVSLEHMRRNYDDAHPRDREEH
ncbi:MAG TPA: site-specific tyrosine recombinase/integron integrase [Candidatus Baltobacteraceae bacterium]